MPRLEMVSTKITSNGHYKFLVTPFFIDFWRDKISKNRAAFFQYDFLLTNGISSIDETDILVRLKRLFKILAYHLEVELDENETSWVN